MVANKTLSRVVVITAIVAVVALGLAAVIGFASGGFLPRQFGRAGVTVDERKSLELQGIDLLSVTFVSGKVLIVEGAGSSVEARVHGTVGTASPDAGLHLVVERSGSTADIRLERMQPLSLGFPWSNLVLEVSVPSGYGKALAVKTVSADVEVADHAYSGLEVSTTSGDMKVGAVSAADVSLRTTSGSLRAARLAAKRADITSVSGDVAIMLPSQAQFELDARSTSGTVTCGFPITIKENRSGGGSHVLSGTVGAGGNMIVVRTVSGDITIAR